MSALRSTALANYIAATGSLYAALNNGFVYVFSGPVPDTADEAIDGSCVLLAKFTGGGDGSTALQFSDTPSNGYLMKLPTQVWQAAVLADGTPTFFRFGVGSDDCTAAADASTGYRLQGEVGLDATAEMIVTSTSWASSDTRTLDTFQVN